MGGSGTSIVGQFFRQFALTIAFSVMISALNALTRTLAAEEAVPVAADVNT